MLLALWLAYNAYVYVRAMLMMWSPSPSDVQPPRDWSHLHLHVLLLLASLLANVMRIDVGEKKRIFRKAIDEAELPQRVLRAKRD